MHIVVCIKQVPDSTRVKVDPKTGTLIRAGVPSILNPYDHYAVEEAVKLKEKTGATLTALCMGPPQAEAVVRLALGLGADRGILLSDRAFAGSDTWATSYALSLAIKKLGKVDLIMCGMMAIDGDTAQTGPGVAQQLRVPQITFCDTLQVEKRKLTAKRYIDGGYEVVEARLPVLCTMVMPYNYEARYPSFVHIANAQEQKSMDTWSASDVGAESEYLGLDGSPTRVDRVYSPPQRQTGPVFEGTAAAMAEKIIELLKQENVVNQ